MKQQTRFLYDGWNLIAEFNLEPGTSNLKLAHSYAWGLDLSGTETGAGGVGGLLFAKLHSAPGAPVLAPCYDGTQGDWRESRETNRRFARQGATSARRERVNCSGNILAYLDCLTGQTLARYEHDPFGKLLLTDEDSRVAGRLHHQFSTKYCDAETGLAYYGYLYYSPELGRWVNRDPIGREGESICSRICETIRSIDQISWGVAQSIARPQIPLAIPASAASIPAFCLKERAQKNHAPALRRGGFPAFIVSCRTGWGEEAQSAPRN